MPCANLRLRRTNMLAVINAELVLRDHLLPDAVLFVEDRNNRRLLF